MRKEKKNLPGAQEMLSQHLLGLLLLFLSGLGFPLSSPLPNCHGPPHPCIPHSPHKQLLVAVVGGAGCHWHHTPLITIVVIVPPVIHPMSSHRAGVGAISFPVTPSSPLLILSWWPPLPVRCYVLNSGVGICWSNHRFPTGVSERTWLQLLRSCTLLLVTVS